MIETMELADPSVVSPFLRRDVLRNCGLLASIERNIPPIPRTVWAAQRHGQTVGAMLVTDGPGQGMVEIRASQPQAVAPLLACLDDGRPYAFSVPTDLLEPFRQVVPQAVCKGHTIILSVRPDDLRSFPLTLDYRRLGPADRPAVQAFPESAPYEPPLSMYLEWALDRPEGLAIYGLFDGEHLIAHVGWAQQIDEVWEATFIRVRSDRQGQGLGRALLARSTRELLNMSCVPLYELPGRNLASLRIAVAAGYHEVCRIHHHEVRE